MTTEERYHYIVYETINLINGKKYIGKHSTKNLNDGYLGSGTVLKKAIKKYGRKNFIRNILAEFNTEKEALDYESKLVTLEKVKSDNYYNSSPGGCGISKEMWKVPEFRKMMTIMQSDLSFLEMQRKKAKEQWKNPIMREKLYSAIVERWKDDKYKEKHKKSMKRVCSNPKYHEKLSEARSGEKNSAAKLTEKDVIEIKKRLKNGKRGIGIKLSKEFGISTSIISSINVGRLWKKIKEK